MDTPSASPSDRQPGASPDSGQARPSRANERTIMVTCGSCPGARGYCGLRVTRIGGEIVLDPHVAGACVLVFDEAAATALYGILGEWLGWPRGAAANSRVS